MTKAGPSPFQHAPGRLGAFFLALALPWLASCERRGTPEWRQTETPAEVSPGPVKPAPPDTAPVPFRFVAYNLQNWLTMERAAEGGGTQPASKPDASKQAAVSLVAAARPDILGVCEIGTRDDLADLQRRLKQAGLDLPHAHFTGGVDPTRHLGLLSRFPITTTATPGGLDYPLDGRGHGMQRGILDATIEVNGRPVRFLGVHLKSKRPVEEGDQAAMRLQEAHLLRRHIDSLLAADPAARLVVYGDFNDTKSSATVKTVKGESLVAPPLADGRGEAWTHAWEAEDLYSRYDWIFVSPALKPRVDEPACGILDSPARRQASDHRPLLAVFR